MKRLEELRLFLRSHQFLFAIGVTVVVACLMTAVSLSLYVSSGTLQLDLSRPGYETARREIINSEQGNGFGASGPIDGRSLQTYQEAFDSQRKELDSIGKFKDKGLEDNSLTLSPETST